jgi:regulator of sigma E protease
MALLTSAIDRGPVPVQVRTADGSETVRTIDFSRLPEGDDLARAVREVGIVPRHQMLAPVVGEISPGSAAEGRLQPGDRSLRSPVEYWADISPLVARMGAAGGGEVVFERDGARRSLEIVPRRGQAREDRDAPQWLLGVAPADTGRGPKDALLRYGPLDAFPAALRETRFQVGELFGMFERVFTGRLAVENSVSGPIGIARAANAYAKNGLAWYLSLLALLSLSLAILNLLPIPVLDGGHLLYYLIELLKGSPLSDRAMAAGQYVGLALLLGLMGLAFYNDIQGLIR